MPPPSSRVTCTTTPAFTVTRMSTSARAPSSLIVFPLMVGAALPLTWIPVRPLLVPEKLIVLPLAVPAALPL